MDSSSDSLAAIDVLLDAHKPHPGWTEILDATRSIKIESHRARTMAHLARHVRVELIRQVLDALRTVNDGPTRAQAFVNVAELLTGSALSARRSSKPGVRFAVSTSTRLSSTGWSREPHRAIVTTRC